MNTREDSEKAHQMVNAGARLVDVRTPAEYAAGHIDGAINLPLQEIPARFAELNPPSRPVVVYCGGGGRAARAEQFLRTNGFIDVLNLGAMRSW